LPCELGGSHSRVDMANLYGRFIRQIYMATSYGGFVWRVKWAPYSKVESKKTLQRNEIEKKGIYHGGSVIAISLCSQ